MKFVLQVRDEIVFAPGLGELQVKRVFWGGCRVFANWYSEGRNRIWCVCYTRCGYNEWREFQRKSITSGRYRYQNDEALRRWTTYIHNDKLSWRWFLQHNRLNVRYALSNLYVFVWSHANVHRLWCTGSVSTPDMTCSRNPRSSHVWIDTVRFVHNYQSLHAQ